MSRIKISELSLGDIFKPVTTYDGHSQREHPSMKVVGLGEDWVYAQIDPEQGDPFEYDSTEVYGAEITPEFIASNDFKGRLSLPTNGKGKAPGRFTYTSQDSNTVISGIRYIHQLQHAMRLCGQTDEADRLKP